jgi:hypothetical protein
VGRSFEDRKLVPQGQDLQGELVLGMEPGQKLAQERGDNRETWPVSLRTNPAESTLRSVTNFLPFERLGPVWPRLGIAAGRLWCHASRHGTHGWPICIGFEAVAFGDDRVCRATEEPPSSEA